MIKNLVLSCGSIKGLSYIGCLKVLSDNQLLKNIENILGCSCGSIFATCICLGYSYNDLYKIFTNVELNIIKEINYDSISEFLNNYGLYSGDKFINIIRIIIKAKTKNSDITFKELFDISNKNLIINATCLNDNDIYYFNHISHPDMKVIDAIRMSISIPWLFKPFIYNDKYYVDGAVLNGFPMDYFDQQINETLGILLYFEEDNMEINNIEDYSLSVILCCSNYNIKKIYQKYKDNIIIISSEIASFDFVLNSEKKKKIIKCGYDCTMQYLDNNFFKKYIDDKTNSESNDTNEKTNEESIEESNKEVIDESNKEVIDKSDNQEESDKNNQIELNI